MARSSWPWLRNSAIKMREFWTAIATAKSVVGLNHRGLMMVALLLKGLLGGWGCDPDAASFPESKHPSA